MLQRLRKGGHGQTMKGEDDDPFVQKLRKAGNDYVVTIPKEAVERRGLRAGQEIRVEMLPAEVYPSLDSKLAALAEASWRRNQAGYRYLADQ